MIASKMSAFSDTPNHFLDWVLEKDEFKGIDKTLIANSFLPRKYYGEYLSSIWENALILADSKQIKINLVEGKVTDITTTDFSVLIEMENNLKLVFTECVVATGNQIPRNHQIKNMGFYKSQFYFQDPWKLESILNVDEHLPILILGNGLTMVDTVLGLIEHGFKGEIYSISPGGYNILPHLHSGLKYSKLIEELKENINIYELFNLVVRHIKIARKFGVSAEPIIDSLRPYTQQIWRSFCDKEKQVFMSKLRHLWGVARHRIPLHSHDKIQKLKTQGKLHIISGRVIDLIESKNYIIAEYFDSKEKVVKKLSLSRVINCTGPETDFMRLESNILKNGIIKGLWRQDNLKLGIRTEIETFRILNSNGNPHSNLYTIGSNLKGELWESTAVNELRIQAEQLAITLIVG